MKNWIKWIALSSVVGLLFTGCNVNVNLQVEDEASGETINEVTEETINEVAEETGNETAEEIEDAAGDTEAEKGEVKALEAGVYYEKLKEEMEGEYYYATYYVILNEDGTGAWSAQDYIELTWTENSINVYDNEYKAEIIDGVLKIYGDGVEYDFDTLDGKLVKPEAVAVAEDAIEDGIYPVYINSFEGTNEKVAQVDIYTENWYDLVDIARLEKGDAIIVDYRFYVIETIENQDNRIIINGGDEEGGTELINPEDTNGYRYFGMDDISSYAYQCMATLPISEDVVLYDSVYTPASVTEYGYDNLEEAYKIDNYFSVYNTTVTIENGVIVEITRKFIP